MKPFAVAALLALAIFAGKSWGEAGTPEIVTRVDSVVPDHYNETLRDLRIENRGLLATLEARSALTPEVIIRTDTLVTPPDTVIRFITVDGDANLSVDFLTARDSLYAPELHRVNVAACDEGWAIQDGEVICDRARLGHLYVGPWLSRSPSLAAWWTPSYRSPWEISVSYSGRWDFGLRRGVRVF